MTTRGTDYFPQRLMFPLADARGRVVGFQARKLREDDPLRGKYVNSPEGDLFHKSAVLYGLHLAKTAIAKQDFAAVVEGNTDVIALRQAGFEPVVASMGTALTGAATARARPDDQEAVPLLRRGCSRSGGDAAGHGAGSGAGLRRQDRHASRRAGSGRCAGRLRGTAEESESYLVYRVRLEIERSADRQEACDRARGAGGRRTRPSARRRCVCLRIASTSRATRWRDWHRRAVEAGATGKTPRLLDAGDRLERDVLAACVAHPSLVRGLTELSSDHFDSEPNRRFRDMLVTGRDDPELTALRAELDARAAQEALDERTGTELLLRLRERKLKRDLAGADLARTTELQAHLAKVRQALAELT